MTLGLGAPNKLNKKNAGLRLGVKALQRGLFLAFFSPSDLEVLF